MNREYHRWFSPRLQRPMELLVLGHGGERVLVFPTRAGRFYDYENWGLAGALAEPIAEGRLQLYCVDSIDGESLYALDRGWEERIWRHVAYEGYLLDEVLPLMELKNPGTPITAHGCSLGAYHAVNLACRHPQRFHRVIGLSGRYDLTRPLGNYLALFPGVPGDTVYYHMPSLFLPQLTEPKLLNDLRRLHIALFIGEEDCFRLNNEEFAYTLAEKGIPHRLDLHPGEAHRARYWRQMLPRYFAHTA